MAVGPSQTSSGNPPRWRPLAQQPRVPGTALPPRLGQRYRSSWDVWGRSARRNTTVSHVILATAPQRSGSMFPIPWKSRGGSNPNEPEQPAGRYVMWCTALHPRGHSGECVCGRGLLKLTLKKYLSNYMLAPHIAILLSFS